MMVNEEVFFSFMYFPGDPDRINHFFYVLPGMYQLCITPGTSHTVNDYGTGNPRPDTRCDDGS